MLIPELYRIHFDCIIKIINDEYIYFLQLCDVQYKTKNIKFGKTVTLISVLMYIYISYKYIYIYNVC